MIEKLGDQVACSAKRGLEASDYILAKGSYNGEIVYFMFSTCALCNTVPPQEGYICVKELEVEKIAIDDFNSNVTDITVVKGCGN